MELSAVTIPANAEATITSVKAFDVSGSAALGTRESGVIRNNTILPAGAPAHLKVKNMTIKEQITAFENKRAGNQ